MRAEAKERKHSQTPKNHSRLYLTLWEEALFTMGVMSPRLYCFWQPSELQPSAKPLEELQMESITIYFDAWESLDIDLRWWQFPEKCWGNQSGWCADAMCASALRNKNNKELTGAPWFTSSLLAINHPNVCQALTPWRLLLFARTCFLRYYYYVYFCCTLTTVSHDYMAAKRGIQCIKDTNGR